ncbi:hypothetical protein [Paraburkholderia tropica]|uniref:hypothetical protein n=1 Tax=Paraburkholderia tropica TaxID=92647 RepID=UPI002AB68CC0|nr:hypothetical protein [Paraburkholderia tropica]
MTNKTHSRLALERTYADKLAAKELAPQAREHSDDIEAITRLAVAEMIPALRKHADKLEAVQTSPRKAVTLREIAGQLELNHTSPNGYAGLNQFRQDALKTARALEELDPEAHNPGPWVAPVNPYNQKVRAVNLQAAAATGEAGQHDIGETMKRQGEALYG